MLECKAIKNGRKDSAFFNIAKTFLRKTMSFMS